MSDRLEDALRAMREGTTGESPRARETLDRVIAAKLEAGRVWRRRARMWLPIAAVLAFSTAALAHWGSLDGVRARLFSTEDAPAGAASPRAARSSAPVGTASSPVANEAPDPPSAPEPAPVALPIPPAPRVPPAPPLAGEAPSLARPRLAVAARAENPRPAVPLAPKQAPDPAGLQAAASSAPAAASESPEASTYAGAHHLHFAGRDPAAALAAWDDYLARFPDGTFAPDARYNRAIDLLKLRRYAEARAALQPFADGAFGGYHRDDARDLLRSVP